MAGQHGLLPGMLPGRAVPVVNKVCDEVRAGYGCSAGGAGNLAARVGRPTLRRLYQGPEQNTLAEARTNSTFPFVGSKQEIDLGGKTTQRRANQSYLDRVALVSPEQQLVARFMSWCDFLSKFGATPAEGILRRRRETVIPILSPRLEVKGRKDQLRYLEWHKNELLRHLAHRQDEGLEVANPEAALRILVARLRENCPGGQETYRCLREWNLIQSAPETDGGSDGSWSESDAGGAIPGPEDQRGSLDFGVAGMLAGHGAGDVFEEDFIGARPSDWAAKYNDSGEDMVEFSKKVIAQRREEQRGDACDRNLSRFDPITLNGRRKKTVLPDTTRRRGRGRGC